MGAIAVIIVIIVCVCLSAKSSRKAAKAKKDIKRRTYNYCSIILSYLIIIRAAQKIRFYTKQAFLFFLFPEDKPTFTSMAIFARR